MGYGQLTEIQYTVCDVAHKLERSSGQRLDANACLLKDQSRRVEQTHHERQARVMM